MSLDRRNLLAALAGLASIAVVPASAMPRPGALLFDECGANFARAISGLTNDQLAVLLKFLRALAVLPENASTDHLYAEAELELAELRGRRS